MQRHKFKRSTLATSIALAIGTAVVFPVAAQADPDEDNREEVQAVIEEAEQ